MTGKSRSEKAAEALARFRESHVLALPLPRPGASPDDVRPTGSPTSGSHQTASKERKSRALGSPDKHGRTRAFSPDRPIPAALQVEERVSREALIERWGCGSDSTFYRAERDGHLIPGRDGQRTGYRWPDVFAFEGGQPPAGMESAYREKLLTPEEVAERTPYTPETIIEKAKRGEIPYRRIGRTYRFVPAEVARWLRSWRSEKRRSAARRPRQSEVPNGQDLENKPISTP